MDRITAAVIFGGQSSEHEVSCMSAANIIEQIDRQIYDLLLIGITKEGRWLKVDSLEDVKSGSWRESRTEAVISPDALRRCVMEIGPEGQVSFRPIDVVFPVLHGRFGEDGTIQGLLEMARIPYVGCGVLSSAVSMDKLYTKILAGHLGVSQAAYEPVMAEELEDMEAVLDRVERRFSYPVFVKPSNAGSSLLSSGSFHTNLFVWRSVVPFDRSLVGPLLSPQIASKGCAMDRAGWNFSIRISLAPWYPAFPFMEYPGGHALIRCHTL